MRARSNGLHASLRAALIGTILLGVLGVTACLDEEETYDPQPAASSAGESRAGEATAAVLACTSFQRGVAVFPTNAAANKKAIYAITTDGRLMQIWDTDQWRFDFPAEAAGHAGLRFKGIPAVFPTNAAANKKSIYAITNNGRLAQIWDTDRWNLDFPAEAAGRPRLRFEGTPAVFPTNAAANKKSIYAVTNNGRLAQIWDTDRWNLDFPLGHCSNITESG